MVFQPAMVRFITPYFLARIAVDGRILDGMRIYDRLDAGERAALPQLPGLSSWECILEEVIDTDHEPEYYARFAGALLERGYTRQDIQAMRMVAWETAGWFNFEMMAWDWCHLSESDMLLGLEDRRATGAISQEKYEELKAKIGHYRHAPGGHRESCG